MIIILKKIMIVSYEVQVNLRNYLIWKKRMKLENLLVRLRPAPENISFDHEAVIKAVSIFEWLQVNASITF